MQTLIAHSHMMWSDVHNRWMSAREVLSLQGFSVHAHHFEHLGIDESARCKLCSFNTSRASTGMAARKRSAMVMQARNSMHISVVGAALLWSAMYTVPGCELVLFTRVLSDLAHRKDASKLVRDKNSTQVFDNSSSPSAVGVTAGKSCQQKSQRMLDTIDNSSSPSAVGVTAGASGKHHFKRTFDQLDNSSSPSSVVVTAGES